MYIVVSVLFQHSCSKICACWICLLLVVVMWCCVLVVAADKSGPHIPVALLIASRGTLHPYGEHWENPY